MCPMAPDGSIAAAEKVKSAILSDILPELENNGWANRLSFGSYAGRLLPSLHTNIGMTIGGKDIFKQSNFEPTELMVALAEGMKAAIHETTILVAPFPSSYGRYNTEAHESYPRQVAVNEQSWTKDGKCIVLKYRQVEREHCMFPAGEEGEYQYIHWIENRLPSGDCQPYVAALATLLGVYDAFRKVVKFDALNNVVFEKNRPQLTADAKVARKDHDISKDFQSARSLFTGGKILRKRLNELDPARQLGDDLHKLELENQAKIRRKAKTLSQETRNSLGALRSL